MSDWEPMTSFHVISPQPMVEYAISGGSGTLLHYGVMNADEDLHYRVFPFDSNIYMDVLFQPQEGKTVILGPASPDCQTGK